MEHTDRKPVEMRPVIFDYEELSDYVKAMLEWRRANSPRFSIRGVTSRLDGLSPSLVTRVASGQRKITRDRVDEFAKLLGLRTEEKTFFDNWVKTTRRPNRGSKVVRNELSTAKNRRSKPNNHILSDWLNVYVKDAVRLKGFRPEPINIHRLLGGISTIPHIMKSLSFLLREGIFTRTKDGKIVKNDLVTITTDEIPDQKVRSFHKHALDIAKRNIDLFPMSRRRESAMILPINKENLPELKELMKEYQERLIEFAEKHETDDEQLYQILMNLTPIGGSNHDET